MPRIRGSVEGLNQEVEKLVLIGNEEEERVSLMVKIMLHTSGEFCEPFLMESSEQ